MALDPHSKVACETLVTTGQVVLAGEVKSDAYVELQDIARDVIREIGYNKSTYCFDADSCGRTLSHPWSECRQSTAGSSAPLPKNRAQGTKVSCSAMLAVRPPL